MPVTAAERDSALAAFEERVASMRGTPDRRPSNRDVKPAHGALFVDDVDNVWVKIATTISESSSWDVFGPDGRFIGKVHTPDPPSFIRPVVRNDRMAVATQINGFPEVVVYTLLRPSR